MVNPRVFFDLSIDSQPVGRVIFELFADTVPKTAENFRSLCTGEKGLSPISERPLYYKNSIIHRSINDFMVQGGDFTKRNGLGGESIYGGPFADEDLTCPLDAQGLLCMANKGPNTNGSQFFITLRPCPHLNGKHVVFGRVIRGYEDVIQKIVQVPVDEKDRPTKPVVIANCGELILRSKTIQEPQSQGATFPISLIVSHSDACALPQVKESESESEDSDRDRHRKRRHDHRSKSPADEDIQDRDRRRKHKKSRRKKSSSRSPIPTKEHRQQSEPQEETEEQYDARLEREEKERLQAARRRELEKLKQASNDTTPTTNGIRFKGRGRMKYVDPELHRSSYT